MTIRDTEHWFEDEGLYAVERGRGQALVFLHGGLADHRSSLHMVGELGARYRVIAPDVRGAGRSIDRGELSWDRLADGVRVVIERLGIDRPVIGGTSAGSGVALRFALRWPSRCAGLVLVSPLFAGSTRGLDDAPRVAMAQMDAHARRALDDGIEALAPLFDRLPEEIRERALAMIASFDPASVAATTRLLASGEQPFASLEQLRSLTMPTLVVPGIDPQHPAEVASLYAEHIPDCRLGDPADLLGEIDRLLAS